MCDFAQQLEERLEVLYKLLQMLGQVGSSTKLQQLRSADEQIQKRKKPSYSSRSGSSAQRSRSKQQKKHKNKHRDEKNKKKRSRSRSKDHKKHKHKDHKNKRSREREGEHRHRNRDNRDNRDIRDNRDREVRDQREVREQKEGKDQKEVKDTRERKPEVIPPPLPIEIPMPPIQIPMPPIPGERRKRERSRSPLGYYRRNQNSNEGQFWDSFTWVPRINMRPTVSSSELANTKKMRRLMITSIPFQIGITQEDLRNLITRFMAQNYLKDSMNSCPVVNLQINETDRNVAVELSSVEETCRLCKLEKIQLFKGNTNCIIRLGDSCYGNNVVTQAQTAAQAQAAAFAAINVLENKKTNFSIDTLKATLEKTSPVLRITNAVTPYMAANMPIQQWNEYQQDLMEGFSQFGTILHHWFVKKDEKDICADPGNMFVEYESKEEAERAMEEMQGRIYDERSITLYFVPRDLYNQNYKKVPAVVAPKK